MNASKKFKPQISTLFDIWRPLEGSDRTNSIHSEIIPSLQLLSWYFSKSERKLLLFRSLIEQFSQKILRRLKCCELFGKDPSKHLFIYFFRPHKMGHCFRPPDEYLPLTNQSMSLALAFFEVK